MIHIDVLGKLGPASVAAWNLDDVPGTPGHAVQDTVRQAKLPIPGATCQYSLPHVGSLFWRVMQRRLLPTALNCSPGGTCSSGMTQGSNWGLCPGHHLLFYSRFTVKTVVDFIIPTFYLVRPGDNLGCDSNSKKECCRIPCASQIRSRNMSTNWFGPAWCPLRNINTFLHDQGPSQWSCLILLLLSCLKCSSWVSAATVQYTVCRASRRHPFTSKC